MQWGQQVAPTAHGVWRVAVAGPTQLLLLGSDRRGGGGRGGGVQRRHLYKEQA